MGSFSSPIAAATSFESPSPLSLVTQLRGVMLSRKETNVLNMVVHTSSFNIVSTCDKAPCGFRQSSGKPRYLWGNLRLNAFLRTSIWCSLLVSICLVLSRISDLAKIARGRRDFSTPTWKYRFQRSQLPRFIYWHLILKKSFFNEKLQCVCSSFAGCKNPWPSVRHNCNIQRGVSMGTFHMHKDSCAGPFGWLNQFLLQHYLLLLDSTPSTCCVSVEQDATNRHYLFGIWFDSVLLCTDSTQISVSHVFNLRR